MACVAQNAESWRKKAPAWSDEELLGELHRGWHLRPYSKDKRTRVRNDWTIFRAATVREARKRGLDISITGLGT